MRLRQRDPVTEEDIAQVDQLLDSMKNLPIEAGLSHVRYALFKDYLKHLDRAPVTSPWYSNGRLKWLWVCLVAAAVLLVGVFVGSALLPVDPPQIPTQQARIASITSPLPSEDEVQGTSTASFTRPNRIRSSSRRMREQSASRTSDLTYQLPYSDRAISTGVATTLRMPLSPLELASLGIPIGDLPNDRMIVAEITLGDDGMPRSVRLPLSPEPTKVKQ